MKTLLLTLLLLAVAALLTAPAARAALPPDVRYYGLPEGLPQRRIHTLWQTPDGFVWVGTEQGLSRFDGTRFEPLRLPVGAVQTIAADSAGRTLWLGGPGSVWRLDLRTGTVQVFPRPNPAAPDQWVRHLLLTKSGVLLATTTTGWLLRLTPGGRFAAVTQVPTPRPDVSPVVNAVAEDRQGRVWLSAMMRGDLFAYTSATDTLRRYTTDIGFEVWTAIAADATGALVAVDDRRSALLRLDDRRRLFVPTTTALGPPKSFGQPLLLPTAQPGQLWLSRAGGVLRLIDQRVPSAGRDYSAALAPYGATATALRADRRGGVWVGTTNGLFHVQPQAALFSTALAQPPDSSSGQRFSLRGMAELPDGELLVNSYRRLVLLAPVAGAGAGPTAPYRVRTALPDILYSVLPDSGGRGAWLSREATGNPLLWFDRATRRTTEVEVRDARTGQPLRLFVRVLLADGRGGLWLGSSTGLFRFDPATRTATQLLPPALAGLNCYALARRGTDLWVGANEGLFVLDAATGRLRRRVRPAALPGRVRALWFTPGDSVLWIGTSDGLGRLALKNNRLRRFTQREGLSNDAVNGLLPDHLGLLWISTDNGLSVLDLRTEYVRRFLATDGLSDAEFNYGSALATRNGALLFGSVNGLTAVWPRQLPRTPRAALLLTELRWHDPAARRVRVRQFGLRAGHPLTLAPGAEFFSLRYALADFVDPALHRFAYRLRGLETTWNEVADTRTLRYPRPPAGTYALELRAAGPDGRWQPAQTVLRLTVEAPYYARWWFRALLAVAAAGLLAGVGWLRRRRRRQLDALRMRLAADLHDDVGGLLTQISLEAQLLGAGTYGPADQPQRLARLVDASRAAVRQMRDVVWSIDARHDSLASVLDHMRDYAYDLLGSAHLELDFQLEEALRNQSLGLTGRQNLYLIYKEALHNIVKHAHATQVTVRVRRDGRHLLLTIADDGPAAAASEPTTITGNGLRTMRERAAVLGGTFSAGRAPTGYTVEVRVPLA